MNFIVLEKSLLLDFLYKNIKNKSKNNIKNLLKNKCIYVNNKCITKYDYLLKEKDNIVIKYNNEYNLDILYEDNDLIIVNKPNGLLTISDNTNSKTLYNIVSSYVKSRNKNNKIFIVNRLDKDTSGIVVFSKNIILKKILQDDWNNLVSIRKYVAIVHGNINKRGIIKSNLKENDEHIVYSSKEGKLAITRYEKIKSNGKYSLINIYLDTGRKNQIRVHMKDNGTPVLGDKKYGIKDNIKRLMLHCTYLEFINPLNKKIIKINCKCPLEFNKVL